MGAIRAHPIGTQKETRNPPMELKHYLFMCGRWAWLLVLGTGLAAAVSFIATAQMPRLYRANTTLMVGPEIERPNPQMSDFSNSERLAQTYVQLVRRQGMLEATVDALQLKVPWQALAGA